MDFSSQFSKGISHCTVDNVEGFGSPNPMLLMPLDKINRYYTQWVLLSLIQWTVMYVVHLTIIPQARMGCESIAHEPEGRMGY